MVTGNTNQEAEKKELYSNILHHKEEIQRLKIQLEEIDRVIVSECVDKYGTHEYIREIETGPYGNSYLVCKHCGFER